MKAKLLFFIFIIVSSLFSKVITVDPENLTSYPQHPTLCGFTSRSIMFYIEYDNQCQPGDTVKFLPGVILLDQPLYLCDDVVFIGSISETGEILTTLKLDPSWENDDGYLWKSDSYVWNHSYNQWEGGSAYAHNSIETGLISTGSSRPISGARVENLNIEGSSPSDGNIDARASFDINLIWLQGSNLTINNCNLKHSTAMGIYINGGNNNTVTNCNIYNTARDGIWMGGTHGIIVSNNIVRATRDMGIGIECMNVEDDILLGTAAKIEHGGRKFSIINNIIDNSDDATIGYVTENPLPGWNIFDPSCYASSGICLSREGNDYIENGELAVVESVVIANNEIKNSWYMGIELKVDVRSVSIFNNKIDGVRKHHGILLNGNNSSISIQNNSLENVRNYGINVKENSNSISIQGNSTSNTYLSGISIEKSCSNVSIMNNSIKNCGHPNQYLEDNGITIRKGTSNEYCSNISIISNTIEGSSGAGLSIEKAKHCTIMGNTFKNNTYEGIRISGGNDYLITNNIFNGNGVGNVGNQRAGVFFAGFNQPPNLPYGEFWYNVFICGNTFIKNNTQSYSIYLMNGDKYAINNNTYTGYTGTHTVYAPYTGINRMILNNISN